MINVNASATTHKKTPSSSVTSSFLVAETKQRKASRKGRRRGKSRLSLASIEVRPYDVLCGRCRTCFHNVGNRRFRLMVAMAAPAYSSAECKKHKGVIIKSIMQTIRETGARFLSPNAGKFRTLDENEVRVKVSHALRDQCLNGTKTTKQETNEESPPDDLACERQQDDPTLSATTVTRTNSPTNTTASTPTGVLPRPSNSSIPPSSGTTLLDDEFCHYIDEMIVLCDADDNVEPIAEEPHPLKYTTISDELLKNAESLVSILRAETAFEMEHHIYEV